MLTRASLRYQQESFIPSNTKVKKWAGVFIAWKLHIIMSVLEDWENSTYNICDENLMNPRFGVKIDNLESVPLEALSEKIKNRVIHFI